MGYADMVTNAYRCRITSYNVCYTKLLRAEAEQIIMNNNQKEIVSLIRSYAPDYASAGETLGSQLVEAFKKKVNNVISYVEDITNQINNYTSSVVAVANSAADNFIAKTSGKQSATSSKSVTIKQTNNINQPVASRNNFV